MKGTVLADGIGTHLSIPAMEHRRLSVPIPLLRMALIARQHFFYARAEVAHLNRIKSFYHKATHRRKPLMIIFQKKKTIFACEVYQFWGRISAVVDGKKDLVTIELGIRESIQSWREVLLI